MEKTGESRDRAGVSVPLADRCCSDVRSLRCSWEPINQDVVVRHPSMGRSHRYATLNVGLREEAHSLLLVEGLKMNENSRVMNWHVMSYHGGLELIRVV